MSFLFPSLLWIGLPLLAAPVLIHLLNLRRQRVVEWAAMEFLLESEQRSKTWVNLKQWLLLAARIMAVLLAVLMLSRPRLRSDLSSWFTSERVHHLVVLDDSFSMSDRGSSQAAWDNAQAALSSIISAASRNKNHRVTVLRTSQVVEDRSLEPDTATGQAALASFAQRVAEWRPGQTASDLSPAISAAARLAEQETHGGSVVAYVVSDFRSRNVEPTERLDESLEELRGPTESIHLTPCTPSVHDNLAVSQLKFLPGPRTAGLELTAEVTVKNFGRRPVEKVTVMLRRDGDPLPAAQIEEVPARGEASCSFPVRFNEAGDHWLMAEIESDAVDADNRRYLAASFPSEREVMVVDGSSGEQEGRAFATALRPTGRDGVVSTGWRPVRVAPHELGQSGDLASFAAVLLLDVPRLNAENANRMDQFVQRGGGVLMVLGQEVQKRNYNSVVFGVANEGFPPIRLDLPTQASEATNGDQGDLVVSDHPVLRVFAGDRNSFLGLIRIGYFHSLKAPEKLETNERVRTIASLRGGAPLMLESTNSQGKVVCLLTTVARPKGAIEGWSNLGVSPVFPVLANELVAYLAEPRLEEPQAVVGLPWASIDLGELSGGEVYFSAVTGDQAAPPADASGAPRRQGVYRATPSQSDTPPKLVAANVIAEEGDLSAVAPNELRDLFAQRGVVVTSLEDFIRSGQDAPQASVYRLLGGALLLLLLLEQFLAVSASHHQPPVARDRR